MKLSKREEYNLVDKFAMTADLPWNPLQESLARTLGRQPTYAEMFEYRAKLSYSHAVAMIKERNSLKWSPDPREEPSA